MIPTMILIEKVLKNFFVWNKFSLHTSLVASKYIESGNNGPLNEIIIKKES